MNFNYHSEYQRYRKYIQNLVVAGTKKPAALISLALVATIFFASVLAIFALRPTLVTISSLVREIQDEKATIQALDNKVVALKQAQQVLERLENRLYLLENAIPSSPSLEEFVKQIEIIAAKNKIITLEFSQKDLILKNSSASAGPVHLSSIPVTVVIGGNETSIRSFIADLELLARIAVVKSVNLTAVALQNREKQPYPLTADINLEIYYQKI